MKPGIRCFLSDWVPYTQVFTVPLDKTRCLEDSDMAQGMNVSSLYVCNQINSYV